MAEDTRRLPAEAPTPGPEPAQPAAPSAPPCALPPPRYAPGAPRAGYVPPHTGPVVAAAPAAPDAPVVPAVPPRPRTAPKAEGRGVETRGAEVRVEDLVKGRPRSGDSAARRTGRAVRRMVGASAARDVAEATRVAEAVQRPVATGRQIVVTSIRGGAGKTTVTALLGRTYAHYRQDPVLMLEADPALGTLPVRLAAPAVRWTCGDLARIIEPTMQLTDITGYLVQLPDRGWLLPGSQGRVGTRLDLAEYRSVMVALRRYFGITVVDCETLPSELSRTALAAAQARVLVAPATVEGVTSTRAVLDWMASLPRPLMLPGTVVVLAASSPHMALDVAAARAHLRLAGVRVLTLPYDRHLAGGGPIRTELLGEATREAATHLAAEVLDRAVTEPR
ncbi:MinD/ParA family protein [Streptomyces varsoviensis]|uniref:nucleotide-binding protein n=1 Tax=Streptomyces varsoviensis TaxID=67373 RepID=UPI0033CF5740